MKLSGLGSNEFDVKRPGISLGDDNTKARIVTGKLSTGTRSEGEEMRERKEFQGKYTCV